MPAFIHPHHHYLMRENGFTSHKHRVESLSEGRDLTPDDGEESQGDGGEQRHHVHKLEKYEPLLPSLHSLHGFHRGRHSPDDSGKEMGSN